MKIKTFLLNLCLYLSCQGYSILHKPSICNFYLSSNLLSISSSISSQEYVSDQKKSLIIEKSVHVAIDELRDELLNVIQEEYNRTRFDDIINKMEVSYIPIHTSDFFELAVGGSWKLIFTSSLHPNQLKAL